MSTTLRVSLKVINIYQVIMRVTFAQNVLIIGININENTSRTPSNPKLIKIKLEKLLFEIIKYTVVRMQNAE